LWEVSAVVRVAVGTEGAPSLPGMGDEIKDRP
jgi:hypothetical protein